MKLPGRLRSTTLGDLLGTLHRGRVNGALELVDPLERRHLVYLGAGLVIAATAEGPASTLADVLRAPRTIDEGVLRRCLLRALASRRLFGQVLIDDFRVSPSVVDTALRRQIAMRLGFLERLMDARVSYLAPLRLPRNALTDRPLAPDEFLHGRRRARDRYGSAGRGLGSPRNDFRGLALQTLGLPAERGVDPAEVKRAYRKLARELHPDLYPAACAEERRRLSARFGAVTEAYRSLVT